MNFFVEQGEGSWTAIGVLLAAVALSACTVTTQLPISRTDTSPTAAQPIEMRPLSPTEKAALTKALTQTVTNPNAAQFKWLPVPVNSSGSIGYCGLVNVKSSFGEYVGFRRFFAMISKGPKGDYVKGQMEHIDGIPPNFSGISTEDGGTSESGLTEENCKEWGYTDFSAAS
jgi:hypothetical protein